MLANLLAADPTFWLAGLAAQWPLWLPLVAGALAVYWLLPRPRAYPAIWGITAAALALLLAGGLLVQTGTIWQETLLFYIFSGITLVAGGLLVTQQNPARAALSFALVILATCGLFLLLAAPFLMAATIIIYAGAIIVTFLFVIMLAQQEGLSDADARSREPLLSTLTGFVLLGALLYVIKAGTDPARIIKEGPEQVRIGDLDRALADLRAARQEEAPAEDEKNDPLGRTRKLMDDLGFNDLRNQVEQLPGDTKRADLLRQLETVVVQARERLLLAPPPPGTPMADLSGPSPATPREEVRRNPRTGVPHLPAENSAYLGRALFTEFLLPVELGGFLLLVATVGAIAIAGRRAGGGRSALPGPPGLTMTGASLERTV
jgi:NADH:ubiquinone oxidoreductase subunit 6 (subunit J)